MVAPNCMRLDSIRRETEICKRRQKTREEKREREETERERERENKERNNERKKERTKKKARKNERKNERKKARKNEPKKARKSEGRLRKVSTGQSWGPWAPCPVAVFCIIRAPGKLLPEVVSIAWRAGSYLCRCPKWPPSLAEGSSTAKSERVGFASLSIGWLSGIWRKGHHSLLVTSNSWFRSRMVPDIVWKQSHKLH